MLALLDWAKELGPFGLLALSALSLASGFIMLPRVALCIVGGAAFGLWAVPAILAGATTGAALAFLLSRHLLRARVAKALGRRPTFERYVAAIGAEGWKVVFLLRLASPLPAFVQNYAAGLTQVGLGVFISATFVGIAPQIALFASMGHAGTLALHSPELSSLQTTLVGLGIATTAAAFAIVTRAARARLVAHAGTP